MAVAWEIELTVGWLMPEVDRLVAALTAVVGRELVLAEPDALARYSVDGVAPRVVVFPADVVGIQAILRVASEHGAAVAPWGNGSKMGLGRTPKAIDVVLCLRRLDAVVDYDVANLTVTVEAGVVLEGMQALLAANRQFLPMDPAFPSRATTGGVMATNASGPKRYAYGAARDLVLGMKVVLANGDLIHAGGKTVKNVAGYDLDKLFIGSLGTLGVIVEVTLRLLPTPEERGTILAAFPSLSTAHTAAAAVVQSQLLPTAVEILNAKALEVVGQGAGICGLALPVEGAREAVERQIADLSKLCRDLGALGVIKLTQPQERDLWRGVRELPERIEAASPGVAWARCSVPMAAASRTGQVAVDAAGRRGLTVALDVRAGNGIVNAWFYGQDGDEARQSEVLNEMRSAAVELGGSMVLERATAKVKAAVPVWGQTGTDYPAMKAIKASLDPGNVLNPGRFVGDI